VEQGDSESERRVQATLGDPAARVVAYRTRPPPLLLLFVVVPIVVELHHGKSLSSILALAPKSWEFLSGLFLMAALFTTDLVVTLSRATGLAVVRQSRAFIPVRRQLFELDSIVEALFAVRERKGEVVAIALVLTSWPCELVNETGNARAAERFVAELNTALGQMRGLSTLPPDQAGRLAPPANFLSDDPIVVVRSHYGWAPYLAVPFLALVTSQVLAGVHLLVFEPPPVVLDLFVGVFLCASLLGCRHLRAEVSVSDRWFSLVRRRAFFFVRRFEYELEKVRISVEALPAEWVTWRGTKIPSKLKNERYTRAVCRRTKLSDGLEEHWLEFGFSPVSARDRAFIDALRTAVAVARQRAGLPPDSALRG
jgi:hypothetical protein